MIFPCVSLPSVAASPDYFPGLDTLAQPPTKTMVAEVGANLRRELRIGLRGDVIANWQVGLYATGDVMPKDILYDRLPEFGLHVTRLWNDAEAEFSFLNSEYFLAGIGGYFAHGDTGERTGPRPVLTAGVGKYWKPFENVPAGFDLGLTLSRVFFGRLRSEPNDLGLKPLRNTRFNLNLDLFYLVK